MPSNISESKDHKVVQFGRDVGKFSSRKEWISIFKKKYITDFKFINNININRNDLFIKIDDFLYDILKDTPENIYKNPNINYNSIVKLSEKNQLAHNIILNKWYTELLDILPEELVKNIFDYMDKKYFNSDNFGKTLTMKKIPNKLLKNNKKGGVSKKNKSSNKKTKKNKK
jgi:hypothetical protein